MTKTVTREIVLGDNGRREGAPVSVLRLHWSAADPLAVVLVVAARPDHPSLLLGRWVMLRDRIRLALTEPAGEPPSAAGHVQLSARGEHVTLTLGGANLPCVVTVPAAPLRAFLAETEAIVPAGLERCASALDAELSRMLDLG